MPHSLVYSYDFMDLFGQELRLDEGADHLTC